MVYLDLILNLCLLVALSVISGFLDQRWPRSSRWGAPMQGFLFGGAAVLGMLNPLILGPGLIFDGRSVMVSLGALYFGPWTAAIASALTVGCRVAIGGIGTIMGVGVVVVSATIGVLAYFHFKPHLKTLSTNYLYWFGVAVHLAMLGLVVTLPAQAALDVLRRIGLPVMLLFPLATVLAGKILSDQESRRRFIADLQRTKQELDSTLQSIADSVIASNLNGSVVLMNAMAETLTGWPGGSAIGRDISEVLRLIDPETHQPLRQPLAEMLAEKSAAPRTGSALLIARNGSQRQIAYSAAPMRDARGSVMGGVLGFRDVTEDYRSREALRQSANLLRIAGKAARLGGWILDAAQDRVTWSDEVAAILEMPSGYAPSLEEALRFYAPEGREKISQAIGNCLSRGNAFDEELPIITARGRRIWVRAIGEAIFNQTGAAAMIQGSLQDITERKNIEEALRESEEDYRKLFEEHAAVKLILDPRDGAIVDANFAAADFYGWSRDELRKMTIQQINTLSPAAVQKEMENVLQRRRVHFEFKHRCAGGAIKDVAVFSSTIKRKGGEYLHSIIHDISERKKTEQENVRLQKQFAQAQKMESVGRLAGGVAHDFNNMLAVIIGRSELALNMLEPAHPVHADLEEIHKAAKRSTDLTRQLLAFARKQTIAPVVLDLNDTIGSMLKMLRRMIGEDVDLLWLPATHLWPVKMDPAQIDQILVNLVVNARDAVRGTGELTIETANVEIDRKYCDAHEGCSPGRYALLAVSDDGNGMDPGTLAHIFEPFFTTKPSGKGTGLGLSTVYGIVKQNNGFINVYSEPGIGSTFKIYLPAAGVPEAERSAGGEPEPARGNETVLLVEDEEAILEVGRSILERYGYIVLPAGRPSEALSMEKGHTGPIHLLVTDVVMPEMNGRDLRDTIKVNRPAIRTLFISGYSADVIAHHGILDESVHYLQKPFSMAAMAAKVRQVLDHP